MGVSIAIVITPVITYLVIVKISPYYNIFYVTVNPYERPSRPFHYYFRLNPPLDLILRKSITIRLLIYFSIIRIITLYSFN